MSAPGNILVIRGGAIGDFILTLPVLSALRRQFPESRLELLGYPHIAHLAAAGGLVDEVQSIEARALAGFFARLGVLSAELAAYFSRFALIVSYLYDPDEIFKTNVGKISKAQFIAGPHRPDERGRLHATEVFLRPLERLAIFDADTVPRLNIRKSAAAGLAGEGVGRVAMHPGSGSERKNWPEACWRELLDRLMAETGDSVLLTGGEAEGGRIERLAGRLPAARCQVAWKLPLPELAAALHCCRAFVGHDSGISHLAAAVGLPGIVLWADTAEHIWRPRGDRVRVLRQEGGIRLLEVDRVFRELATFIG
jgi:heptosyltransferase-2